MIYNFKEGMKIKCIIQHSEILDGKLHYEEGHWFICQNIKCGQQCSNKLGYRNSWHIGYGSEAELRSNEVSNIVILPMNYNYLFERA